MHLAIVNNDTHTATAKLFVQRSAPGATASPNSGRHAPVGATATLAKSASRMPTQMVSWFRLPRLPRFRVVEISLM